MCRYKLATYWRNFTEIYLTRVKILQKVLGGGATLFTHTVVFVILLIQDMCIITQSFTLYFVITDRIAFPLHSFVTNFNSFENQLVFGVPC